jgi:homoserine O-succinyltransferase
MVVNIDSSRFSHDRPAGSAPAPSHAASGLRANGTSQCITIGLLNNMAGAAFKATERQFVSLLDSASEGIPIHVSFYTLPGLSRTESGGPHFASHYAGIDELWNTQLDGLIVTGREPKMASLRDEPYWHSFIQVLEWARDNTHSTVWSCLAAHAAILHMDGIDRRKSKEKNFGVFECARGSDHPLTQGLAPHFHVPHSRWNGVAHEDLIAHGYSVLSRVSGGGVDAFVKEEKSLFVFFQGHLEYDSDTLMREYRRDVGRYIKGETISYPLLPHGYFDRSTEQALTALRDEVGRHRNTGLLANLVTAMEKTKIENRWQPSATRIYRNWLECIRARKSADKRHAATAQSMAR